MMLIGTSLGQCIKDILDGTVNEKDVVMIITRTMAPDAERFIPVLEQYYSGADGHSYDLSVGGTKTFDEVQKLGLRLFNGGKIHQPRCFPNFGGGYVHPGMSSAGKWIELAPTNWNNTPAVVEAYKQYRVLDALTRD
jgi:hypothetical protein